MPDTVTLRRGDTVTDVPIGDAEAYKRQGFTEEGFGERVERLGQDVQHEVYGGVGGKLEAGGLGLLSGLTVGLSDVGISALGGGRTLEGLRAENPYTSVGSQIIGAILPSVLSGGAAAPEEAAGIGATLGRAALSRSPAAIASQIGRGVTEAATREGAGLAGRVAGHIAGAGAEGALYGGGNYLSEMAIENKPLSAEGFVGAMGKGALFAAPVGGGFALGGEALLRARSLFPRSGITPEAAAVAKGEATSALQQSVSDGDAMAEAARRKIAILEAQEGAAGARTQVTRAAFGGGDPASLGAEVDAASNKAQLVDALGKLETSQQGLKDWIASGGDADLEASLSGLRAPEHLLASGARATPGVPVGEFGAPGAGGVKSSAELARAAAEAGEPDLSAIGEKPISRTIEETANLKRPAQIAEGTPARAAAPSLDDIQPTSEATVVQRGVRTGLPGEARIGGRYRAAARQEAPPTGPHKPVALQEVDKMLRDQGITDVDVMQRIRAGDTPGVHGIPEHGKLDMELTKSGEDYAEGILDARDVAQRGYYEPAGGHGDATRTAKARQAIAEGQREPIKLGISRDGKIVVEDGRHRLQAAIEADAPIHVKWTTSREPPADMVFRGGGATAKAADPADDLLAALSGTKSALDRGEGLDAIGAPAREVYVADKAARTKAASEHFRGKAVAKNYARSAMAAAEREAQAAARAPEQSTSVGRKAPTSPSPADARINELLAPPGELPSDREGLGKLFGIDLAEAPKPPPAELGDPRALMAPEATSSTRTVVDRALRERMQGVSDDAAIERLLAKRTGKNVDMGPSLARAAQVIGEHEGASAAMADLLGAEAPKTAVERAGQVSAARRAQAGAQGASAAKAAETIGDRALPAAAAANATAVDSDIVRALRKHASATEGAKDRAVVSMQRAESRAAAQETAAAPKAQGVGGKLADIGTALEVLHALGVHVPALSSIPVIGPVLGLFLKARAVLSILGRKGGSIGRSSEGVIASKAAETRDRLARATQVILTGTGKKALKLSAIADGPAALLGFQLFPGDGTTRGKDAQKLYQARSDEIDRALRPGAIDHAIADRYPTANPELHDAIVAQVQRGMAFLDSKRPKPTIPPGMLPGDGVWMPSRAQLDEFAKYVHAVGDPASVLEDLALGHVTYEGAETLRVVYPELFKEAQGALLQAAPRLQKVLPYPTRVTISILYRVPVDGSMTPGHLQYLRGETGGRPSVGPPGGSGPAGGPPAAPGLTGPIKLGHRTLTPLDQRSAGA